MDVNYLCLGEELVSMETISKRCREQTGVCAYVCMNVFIYICTQTYDKHTSDSRQVIYTHTHTHTDM
jgi:hypothetical protein